MVAKLDITAIKSDDNESQKDIKFFSVFWIYMWWWSGPNLGYKNLRCFSAMWSIYSWWTSRFLLFLAFVSYLKVIRWKILYIQNYGVAILVFWEWNWSYLSNFYENSFSRYKETWRNFQCSIKFFIFWKFFVNFIY